MLTHFYGLYHMERLPHRNRVMMVAMKNISPVDKKILVRFWFVYLMRDNYLEFIFFYLCRDLI
jgi:hypothetical protein